MRSTAINLGGLRTASAILAFAVAGSAILPFGCGSGTHGRADEASEPDQQVRGPNAFDIVKMCRFSDEEGPVYFPHAVHADLKDIAGNPIPCSRCHHELSSDAAAVPRACGKCHLQHDHIEAKELLTM